MLKTAPRRWALTVVLIALPLTANWAVRAGTDPVPEPSPAPAPPASRYLQGRRRLHSQHQGQRRQQQLSTILWRVDTTTHLARSRRFCPSNATSVNGQFLSPKAFYNAQYCGHCHQEAYHQWRQSVHSNAFRNPWYLKNVNLLIAEKGVQYSRHCEGCHNPVALLSGDLSQGMPKKRPFEDEGLTCSTCHSILSTDATGTGSYVMGIPAVIVDEKGEPVTRPVSDTEILSHLDRHSKAVMRPLYKTAEFCAACHKAAIPRSLDEYKFLRAFTVYDEWQGASFTKQSPLPFYRKDVVSTCQTCHMKSNRWLPVHPIPAPRTVSSKVIAGSAPTRSWRPTTSTTSRPKSWSRSSRKGLSAAAC